MMRWSTPDTIPWPIISGPSAPTQNPGRYLFVCSTLLGIVQRMSDQPLSRAREFSDLPPYYLMLSFWGEKYRNYFYSLCLPSLLSPNNLPLLQHVRGSKLVISTTTED